MCAGYSRLDVKVCRLGGKLDDIMHIMGATVTNYPTPRALAARVTPYLGAVSVWTSESQVTSGTLDIRGAPDIRGASRRGHWVSRAASNWGRAWRLGRVEARSVEARGRRSVEARRSVGARGLGLGVAGGTSVRTCPECRGCRDCRIRDIADGIQRARMSEFSHTFFSARSRDAMSVPHVWLHVHRGRD